MKQILILGCLIVSISLACGGAKTPAPAALSKPAASSFGLGQNVKVGEIRWKITGAKNLGQTLKSDNQFIKEKSTSGRFVQVTFEIENQSKDLKTFAGLDVVDKQGRVYKASSDALAFIQEDTRCILENINPNIVKSCLVIYEMPQDATGLKAKATDLMLLGMQEKLIDLGL